MAAIRRTWTVWLLRYPAESRPYPPTEPSDVRRSADLTADPRNHPSQSRSSPIKPIQIPSRLESIGRAGLSRRALKFVRSWNQAIEPGHRAAVILLGDVCE